MFSFFSDVSNLTTAKLASLYKLPANSFIPHYQVYLIIKLVLLRVKKTFFSLPVRVVVRRCQHLLRQPSPTGRGFLAAT